MLSIQVCKCVPNIANNQLYTLTSYIKSEENLLWSYAIMSESIMIYKLIWEGNSHVIYNNLKIF